MTPFNILVALAIGAPLQAVQWPVHYQTWLANPCPVACFTGGSAQVGDFNSDGRLDVLAASEQGVATLWDGLTGAVLRHFVAPMQTPLVLAIVGDINGDNVPEVLAGTRTSTVGGVFVFSGASGGVLRTIQDAQFSLGFSVHRAGDVDQDGVDDHLISALPPAGQGRVYSGRTGVLLRTYAPLQPPVLFGYATCAADVNMDGRLDHIFGAPDGTNSGVVYVFNGVTGGEIVRAVGTGVGSWFGSAVAVTANFDGHPGPDILVGAPLTGAAGEVVLVSSATGQHLRSFKPLAGQAGRFDRLGYSVAACPDIDGDGIVDLAASGQGQPTQGGAVWLFSGGSGYAISRLSDPSHGFGSATIAVGDLDNDGHVEVITGSPNVNAGQGQVIAHSLRSPAATATFGVGCPPGLPLNLSYGNLPRLGRTLSLQVTNGPVGVTTLAVVVIGLATNNSDLAPVGMPGCRLYVDSIVDSYPLILAGSATFAFPIPSDGAVLCGASIQQQVLAVDSAANQLGVTATNRGTVTIGF